MWFAQQPIAHRGLHDETRPENTLAAFEAAANAGYPIELDVHASADGEVVVFHDERLDRLTPERGPLCMRRWAELRTIRVGRTDERIPSLRQVLDLVGTRVPVLVEIKNDGEVGRLEAAVAKTLVESAAPIAVQSFNPMSLLWFRRHYPHVARGMLASDFHDTDLARYEKFVLRRLLLVGLVAPRFIGYDIASLPYWAPALLRRVGLPVVAWTVRTPEALARARALADNVIFEHVRP